MQGTEYLEAILLGIVQGIAEFLPISSSGHLVIVGELLQRWTGKTVDPEHNLQLNVAVHLGTLFSILVVYRRDLVVTLRNKRLCLLIIVATIPVVVAGLSLKGIVKEHLLTPLPAGICLFITAGFLVLADRVPAGDGTAGEMTAWQAGVIGLFQSVAILPGVSRSGSTISGGLMVGLKPDDAARFSFFIAIPAIAGAVVLIARDIIMEMAEGTGGDNPLPVLAVGAVVAFVVGCLSLWWLLGLIRRRRLRWFAWYCGLVGAATVAWQMWERSNG